MSASNSKPRILVSDKLTDEGLRILAAGGEFEVVNEPGISPEDRARNIGEFDALAIRSGGHGISGRSTPLCATSRL